jgi:predicted DNA-binding transcriptional regulator YafY
MGRRSPAETLAAIVAAFHKQRTWRQVELGKEIGVDSRTIRANLELLAATGRFPLERLPEGAHVYWSLPKSWFPGGAAIAAEDVGPLARLLARAPRGKLRDRMLAMLLACAPPREPGAVALETMEPPPLGEKEDRMLELAQTAAAHRVALAVRYYTAGRGEETKRWLSVHRIETGEHPRLVAFCHKRNELRTFRVDRIRGALMDPGVRFQHVDEAEVTSFIARSVDGYHGDAKEPVRCVFFVGDPEALWVEGNLLSPMRATRVDGGIEVTVHTTGIERVARYVVGLGGAAVVSTPELREQVRALAQGALAAMTKA